MNITLSTLLKGFIDLPSSIDNIAPQHVTHDTRTLKKGDVFFALHGTQQNGNDFIKSALQKKASAIICDTKEKNKIEIAEKNIPIISIQNLKNHLGEFASRFYGYPQNELALTGVTGTNGKTSCAYFIASALQYFGHTTGLIGTLGYGLPPKLHALSNTTPDIFTTYRLLREFKNQGAKSVAMEVSSHAIEQERIQGLKFKIGLFTNLTQDHLDYHGTLEAYAACKRAFFENYPIEFSIFNQDDSLGKNCLHTLKTNSKKYAYTVDEKSVLDPEHTAYASHYTITIEGIKAIVKTPWGDGVLHSSLLGKFNLSNLLATLTALGLYDIPLSDILNALSHLHSVTGRMEKLGGNKQPFVFVDYSHTPDALQKALETIKTYCKGELWCVFGCGGDRDKTKRAIMGNIAEQFADNVIVTDDNPRSEDPKEIVLNILDGFKNKEKVIIEHDRHRAIWHAISCAQPEDIILIAGKGHEMYQHIGNEKKHFCDQIEAQLALNNRIEKL